MAEWQPIETAPKDGTRFLAFHNSGAQTLAEVTGQRTNYRTGEKDGWDIMAVGLRCSTQQRLADFTHWMPLPSPPAGTKAGT